MDNFVENFASLFKLKFKNLLDFFKTQIVLWKTLKLRAKKNFQIEKKLVEKSDL